LNALADASKFNRLLRKNQQSDVTTKTTNGLDATGSPIENTDEVALLQLFADTNNNLGYRAAQATQVRLSQFSVLNYVCPTCMMLFKFFTVNPISPEKCRGTKDVFGSTKKKLFQLLHVIDQRLLTFTVWENHIIHKRTKVHVKELAGGGRD